MVRRRAFWDSTARPLSLRLTASQHSKLALMAGTYGLSLAATVRLLIEQATVFPVSAVRGDANNEHSDAA